MPDVFDSYLGAVLLVCSILIVLSYITLVAVGFNRMSVIPLILSVAGFTGNLGAYLAGPVKGIGALYTVRLLAYLGWYVEEVAAPFYSFFMLEAILRHDYAVSGHWLKRRYFVWAFSILCAANICVRISITAMYVVWWGVDPTVDSTHSAPPLLLAIEHMDTASYTLLAMTEILAAFGLLVVFHSAVKSSEMYCGGEKVGLFRRMTLSAEIRVASLAIIGLTRAAVSKAKRNSQVAYGFHMFMWTFQHVYTMVLIMDLLITKMAAPRYVKVDKSTGRPVDRFSTGTLEGGPPAVVRRRLDSSDLTTTLDDDLVMRTNTSETKERKGSAGMDIKIGESILLGADKMA